MNPLALLLIVLAMLLLILGEPAKSEGVDLLPLYENAPAKVERVSCCKTAAKPKRKRVVKRKRTKPAPAVAGWTANVAAATETAVKCLAPVQVVGSQDIREGAAEESAQKAWSEQVRWAHGEAFMDMGNAKDYQRRCSRSSIGEVAGQVFHRCEIIATPCRPGLTQGGSQ